MIFSGVMRFLAMDVVVLAILILVPAILTIIPKVGEAAMNELHDPRFATTLARGLSVLRAFRGFAVAGCEPDEMGIGQVSTCRACCSARS